MRLVLALGERDSDSLDTYHGPPAWQTEARARRATLGDTRAAAESLSESLAAIAGTSSEADVRRTFLVRQLRAVVTRIDIVRGARPPFVEEARTLFGLEWREGPAFAAGAASAWQAGQEVRAQLERLLPGRGDLTARYAAFDRRFLIAPDRLSAVLSRAIDGCRNATRAHITLPLGERVDLEYAPDLAWSAFTRYQGRFASRIQVNAALPLTVDRALDLACHEAYPGHHTIDSLLDMRFGSGRVELAIRPLFSPQSLLHEAASSVAGALAFPGPERLAFERDFLFPLAGLNPAEADRYLRVSHLVDQLRGVQTDIARRYLDGELDFPRAAAALERDALMPSADATLKFLNRFRSYGLTYTAGREAFLRYLDTDSVVTDTARRWQAYTNVVTDPSQVVPSEALRK